MIIYKRNIRTQLLLLRLIFCTILPSCIYLVKTNHKNLDYFLTVVLLSICTLTASKLIVTQNTIVTIKYFICGLLPIKRIITRTDIPNTLVFQETDTEYMADSGTWWDFIAIFFPIKVKRQGIQVRKTNENGRTRYFKTALSDEEFELLSKWLEEPMALPIT